MKLVLRQPSISHSGSDADKLNSPVAPEIKAKGISVFHIQDDKHTLVAGFKARFRINRLADLLWNRREG